MKFTKDDIGKKFKLRHWCEGELFLLLALTSNGHLLGENQDGNSIHFEGFEDWLPYEPKPNQEVLMSPSVLRSINGNYSFGYFQSDKPLRVVLKNMVYTNPDGTIELSSTKTLEADLWIKLDGEQS